MKLSHLSKTVLICVTFWTLVLLFIRCSAVGQIATISWNSNPLEEQVTSYRIYRGIELLEVVTVPIAHISLPIDCRSTISVVAVNINETSAPATITLVPFTPRFTKDLKTWTSSPSKTIFIKAEPKLFANFTYPLQ